MNKISHLTIYLISVCLLVACSTSQKFTNPVILGDLPDPTVIRVKDTYYAASTSSEWAPFYPYFKSNDLVNWTQIGHVFDIQPEWTLSSFWAPELYEIDGKVYCYYTARRRSDGITCIGVAIAESPESPFVDQGILIDHGTEAIDAFIFEDHGQLYITWKAYGLDDRNIEIVGSKLSADGLRLEGELFSLLRDDEGIGMEGQYHYKQGDYYYLIYAARDCCGPKSNYDVRVARAKSFTGPYEKHEGNPILVGGDEYVSVGHGTAVKGLDDQLYYLCHGYLAGDNVYQGRQPILQQIKMNTEGWPYFVTGKEAIKNQLLITGARKQKEIGYFEDFFDGQQLKPEWTWNYPYATNEFELNDQQLILKGTAKLDNNYGTAMCIRPTAAHYAIETQVVNQNEASKGLTLYGDHQNLMLLSVEGDDIYLKSVQDGKETLVKTMVNEVPDVYLKMEINRGVYCDFFWSSDGTKWNKINQEAIDATALTRWDRVARPGLLHAGKTNEPAVFSYFRMRNML
ncbi:family 43 glycosylhydrolase [Sphingobacterium sp. lm-10]|uniref:family 43 glycosylhydrolase n=1 Tax=Sphingobacterium sp. lm-10 TaxID=2944904 RepID=UPI002020213A|nr:family 43 glycosylhydrolase [Sphingobacterium sp. lm-10]MCL7986717.1 family 43 glycosylhydrolase [Sphingobacterium sp. lm-10]